MKIIRPHGASATQPSPDGRRRRVLRQTAERRGDPPTDVPDIALFARTHAPLLIGQWVSVIDRIATKPKGKNKPTHEQRTLRAKLGSAAWAVIEREGLIEDPAAFKALWDWKIAPYPQGDSNGQTQPDARGRWFRRFAGEVEPGAVDATAVAEAIHTHLHRAAMRARAGDPLAHPEGLIAARANSIARSLPAAQPMDRRIWDDTILERYVAAGDVAAAIREAAEAREAGSDETDKRRWVGADVAMAELARHHGRLFRHETEDRALTVREIKARQSGDAELEALWTLHEAVQEVYRRILKRHKKGDRDSQGRIKKVGGFRRSRVARLLPRDSDQLFRLLGHQLDNRELSALIRLGRVLHYEAADRAAATGAAGDSQAHVLTHWPQDHARSRYWTSDGQAEIKGVEAFVRVWRRVLVFAARTLNDWCAPEAAAADGGDILANGSIQKATGQGREPMFDRQRFADKADRLFGARTSLVRSEDDPDFEAAVLRLALRATSRLRNGAFHFTGLGGFVASLTACGSEKDGDPRRRDAVAAARKLWDADSAGRAERIRESLIAAHCNAFFDKTQNRRILDAVAAALAPAEIADAPLPRFVRVVDRAKATRLSYKRRRLPDPVNREKLDSKPALHCKYVTLKLLYERPFRRWLSDQQAARINEWIAQAVDRANEQARNLNAQKHDPEDRRKQIVARAGRLGGLAEGERIHEFMARLTAASAGEARVQSNYESEGENARQQADFIDHLLCDVIARGFFTYLAEKAFTFVLDLKDNASKPPRALCDLNRIDMHIPQGAAEDWQVTLYLVAHLVPVEEIGKLLHQLRKFEILERKRRRAEAPVGSTRRPATRDVAPAASVASVLELYLDMHDAKFTGDAAMAGLQGFAAYFETPELFARVMAVGLDSGDDRLIPRRGLREVARFGGLDALHAVFEKHRITAADVRSLGEMEAPRQNGARSVIAEAQQQRASLHQAWKDAQDRSKREKGAKFTGQNLRDYVKAVATVARYRRLAGHVRLVDHLRLYRIMISVLGRLVDFSGLWERDMYFAALGIIHGQNKTAATVFGGKGGKALSRGVILGAVDKSADSQLKASLDQWFSTTAHKKTRNDMAHLNMLAPASPDLTLPLVNWIDKTRRLMAHDRKLQNAVTKSVIGLLAREKLTITWRIDVGTTHGLTGGLVDAGRAHHLKGLKLVEARKADGRKHPIAEEMYGRYFISMVAALFGAGVTHDDVQDVAHLPITSINWETSVT